MHNILEKMLLFLFLFFSMLLLCSFFRLKELFQVKNGLTTSLLLLLFFLKIPKIWVGRTTLNGEKKEDGLTYKTGRANLKVDQRILFIIFPLDVMY